MNVDRYSCELTGNLIRCRLSLPARVSLGTEWLEMFQIIRFIKLCSTIGCSINLWWNIYDEKIAYYEKSSQSADKLVT